MIRERIGHPFLRTCMSTLRMLTIVINERLRLAESRSKRQSVKERNLIVELESRILQATHGGLQRRSCNADRQATSFTLGTLSMGGLYR